MPSTTRLTALLLCALAGPPAECVAASTGHAFFPSTALANLRTNVTRVPVFRDWFTQEMNAAALGWTVPPRPLAQIDSGTNPNSTAQVIVDGDMNRLLALALDAALVGRAASRDQANVYLTAWARTYVPTGDPAAEQPFLKLLMSYELVRELLPPATDALVETFLTALYDTQVSQRTQPGLNVTPWSNKWSMSAAFTTAVAFLLADAVRIDAVSTFYAQQLQRNVLPTGTFRTLYPWAANYPLHPNTTYATGVTLDFIQRDALLYHVTSISGLYTAALVAEQNGRHWFGGLSGRLAWGFDFLVPYATGQLAHLDFAQSVLTTDAGRQAWFDPAEGIRTLTVAAPLAARFRPYASLATLNRDAQLLVCATYSPSFWGF